MQFKKKMHVELDDQDERKTVCPLIFVHKSKRSVNMVVHMSGRLPTSTIGLKLFGPDKSSILGTGMAIHSVKLSEYIL